MKNLFVIAAVLLALTAASCRKAYICECTITDSAGNTHIEPHDLGKLSQKDADTNCEIFNIDPNTNDSCVAKS